MPESFHESQYDGWSSRLPTVVSIYAKHAGCVLRFAELYGLLRLNQAIELVAVRV